MKKNFEEFLQDEFMNLRELGGVPITKDNFEDMFSSWLENREISELIDYGQMFAVECYQLGLGI
jgi:hypothetical protein